MQQKHGTLLDPDKENTEDLMSIGRAYYTGEKFKSADSVFNELLQKLRIMFLLIL